MYHGYVDLPTFSYFTFGNIWSGSLLGDYNYKIIPKGKDEPPVLHTIVWYGTLCLEKTEPAEEFDFPLTDEGYEEMIAALNEKIDTYRKNKLFGTGENTPTEVSTPEE